MSNSVSLCMIVKDEADNLVNCLDSAKDFVDEVIIVDTGSIDNTKYLARDWGAKVYDYAWENDFAKARNFALEKVTTDWVLVLDGDEILVSDTIPSLKKLIAEENNLVVNLMREEIGTVSSPYSLLSRLFRRHPQIQFSRPYHALIDDHVIALQQQETHWQIVDFPTVTIQHTGYQPEIIQAEGKTERAKQAMESYLKDHPRDAYVCNKLGALYLQIGEEKKGVKLLKTGLKANTGTPAVVFELHYHYANAMLKEKNPDTAVKHYQKAIAQPLLDKLKLGAYHNFGSLCMEVQDFESAVQLFEHCVKIEPKFALAYYNLGLAYRSIGNNVKALSAYKKAIKYNPNYPWAYQNLGVLLLKQGQVKESGEAFKKAVALHQQQNPQVANELKKELGLMGIFV